MMSAVLQNSELLKLVAKFHGRVSESVNADRWPDQVPSELRTLLQSSNSGERRLTNWICDEWKVDTDFRYEFAEPRHRLALLSADQIEQLLLHCGAATFCTAVTRAIDRNTQTAFRDAVGTELHEFVLKRASFLVRGLPDQYISTIKSTSDVANDVQQAGCNLLLTCLHDAPDEILNRFHLLLPADAALQSSEQNSCDAVWSFVKRILITEVSPELKSCFS